MKNSLKILVVFVSVFACSISFSRTLLPQEEDLARGLLNKGFCQEDIDAVMDGQIFISELVVGECQFEIKKTPPLRPVRKVNHQTSRAPVSVPNPVQSISPSKEKVATRMDVTEAVKFLQQGKSIPSFAQIEKQKEEARLADEARKAEAIRVAKAEEERKEKEALARIAEAEAKLEKVRLAEIEAKKQIALNDAKEAEAKRQLALKEMAEAEAHKIKLAELAKREAELKEQIRLVEVEKLEREKLSQVKISTPTPAPPVAKVETKKKEESRVAEVKKEVVVTRNHQPAIMVDEPTNDIQSSYGVISEIRDSVSARVSRVSGNFRYAKARVAGVLSGIGGVISIADSINNGETSFPSFMATSFSPSPSVSFAPSFSDSYEPTTRFASSNLTSPARSRKEKDLKVGELAAPLMIVESSDVSKTTTETSNKVLLGGSSDQYLGDFDDLPEAAKKLRPRERLLYPIFAKKSKETGVSIPDAMAIADVESRFNPLAVGPRVWPRGKDGVRRPTNAKGVMQVLPSTGEYVGVPSSSLMEPEANIEAGMKYYAEQLRNFGHRKDLAAAAYNAGPGNVKNWQVPEIPETEDYVEKFSERKRYYAYILKPYSNKK